MSDGSNSKFQFGAKTRRNTAWCSEIDSLMSLEAPELHASSDVREPISLHQAVHRGIWWIKYAIKKTKTTTTMLNFLVKKVHKTGQKAHLSKAWPFYHPQKQIHSWNTLRAQNLKGRKEKVNVRVLPSLLGADKISGARWAGLPPTAKPRTSGVVRLGSWAWSAKPKSHTLTTPSRESRTLSNFISRWTTPCWLRKSSASESCLLQSRSISNCQNCKWTWKSDEILCLFSEKKNKNWHLDQTKNTAQPRRGIKPRVPLITSRTL